MNIGGVTLQVLLYACSEKTPSGGSKLQLSHLLDISSLYALCLTAILCT